MSKQYPHESGDVIVIGPECFAALDGSALCWKGVNYVPQTEETASSEAGRHANAARGTTMSEHAACQICGKSPWCTEDLLGVKHCETCYRDYWGTDMGAE